MSEYSSSLFSLLAFVLVFTFGTISYVYGEEQAAVRAVHVQVIKEMAGAGYLDSAISDYYTNQLKKEGFKTSTGAFFTPSHRDPSNRAVKPLYGQVNPRENFVHLETRVKPSFTTQMINWLKTGQGDFLFRNDRESQYIPHEG